MEGPNCVFYCVLNCNMWFQICLFAHTSVYDCLCFSVQCVYMSSTARCHQCWLCLGAACGGWHRESSLELLVPAWSWLGRVATAWGPPGLPPTRLYRPQGLLRFHQALGLPAATHTRTHAWYAHAQSKSSYLIACQNCMKKYTYIYVYLWLRVMWMCSPQNCICGNHVMLLEQRLTRGSVWTERMPNSNSY